MGDWSKLFEKCAIAFILLMALQGCQPEFPDKKVPHSPIDVMAIPPGFPSVQAPADNAYTPDRWLLGKKLFFDKRLSKRSTVSCASCHLPQLAFSDSTALSKGDRGITTSSNSPTLANVAYHPYLTRAGGVPTLEMQILVPIQEHEEFDFNIVELAQRLSDVEDYHQMAIKAYDREMDPYVITRALANFERSLISGHSPYDLYTYQGKSNALSELALQGRDLFYSDKTHCSQCHGGFNFTHYAFENNGLYTDYADPGRQRFTQLSEDNGKFKVPTLRNIGVTGPYMHDGSLPTLRSVLEHYNQGGQPHPNTSSWIQPLELSESDMDALIAFLESLTDELFLQNPNFKDAH
jgi:cytochrome c peroxidase